MIESRSLDLEDIQITKVGDLWIICLSDKTLFATKNHSIAEIVRDTLQSWKNNITKEDDND